MRQANVKIFDSVISGAGTWYSGSQFNELLGLAEQYAVQAVMTDVSTPGSLTVKSEHSSDGLGWCGTALTEISTSLAEDASAVGTYGVVTNTGARVRFAISLTGLNPKCRLKLYVTTRGIG
jgi:hypothetical protein